MKLMNMMESNQYTKNIGVGVRMTIEDLLKKYEPTNPVVTTKLVKTKYIYNGIGCQGSYPDNYLDNSYWNNVVNADDRSEE